jgi:hypothetical protein
MNPRIAFILVMLGLLLLANILMLSGFTNYPNNKFGMVDEGFVNYFSTTNAAPAGPAYQPIGTYDGLRKTPEHGLSEWRDKAPNEALLGPEAGPDDMFIFKNNQCKPECCGASFSCGGGCVCTTPKQRDLINSRGGNRTAPTDSL